MLSNTLTPHWLAEVLTRFYWINIYKNFTFFNLLMQNTSILFHCSIVLSTTYLAINQPSVNSLAIHLGAWITTTWDFSSSWKCPQYILSNLLRHKLQIFDRNQQSYFCCNIVNLIERSIHKKFGFILIPQHPKRQTYCWRPWWLCACINSFLV